MRLSRRRALALTAVPAFVLALFLLRQPILIGIARAVEVRDPVAEADFIFLLGGDARFVGRAQHAAALYAGGFAPRVLLARTEDPPAALLGLYPNDTDVSIALLRRFGVPDMAIRVLAIPGGVTSTTDEGRVLASHLRRYPASRVLVVTSDYHTRRAGWAVRRPLRGSPVEVRVSGAPDPRFSARDWWRSEAGVLAYTEEYLKFAHNLLYR